MAEEKFNIREKLFMLVSRLKKRALESALDEVETAAINDATFNLTNTEGTLRRYQMTNDELTMIAEKLRHLTPQNAIRILYTSYLEQTYKKAHPPKREN